MAFVCSSMKGFQMLFSRFVLLASVGFLTLLISQQTDASVMVTVGNINNAADDTGYGAVG